MSESIIPAPLLSEYALPGVSEHIGRQMARAAGAPYTDIAIGYAERNLLEPDQAVTYLGHAATFACDPRSWNPEELPAPTPDDLVDAWYARFRSSKGESPAMRATNELSTLYPHIIRPTIGQIATVRMRMAKLLRSGINTSSIWFELMEARGELPTTAESAGKNPTIAASSAATAEGQAAAVHYLRATTSLGNTAIELPKSHGELVGLVRRIADTQPGIMQVLSEEGAIPSDWRETGVLLNQGKCPAQPNTGQPAREAWRRMVAEKTWLSHTASRRDIFPYPA